VKETKEWQQGEMIKKPNYIECAVSLQIIRNMTSKWHYISGTFECDHQ